jgi:hypothetical protein
MLKEDHCNDKSQCHAHLGRDWLAKCNSAEPEELLG